MSIDHTLEETFPLPTENQFHPILRGIAQVLSIILHPLFVPLIGAWFIVNTHYYQFASFDKKSLFSLYGSIVANTLILPAFTVFFLKKLKFIKSIRMHSQQDRVIPYIAVMTFYFWAFMVFNHQDMMPLTLTAFLLGNFIAVVFAFISNLFLKISMHTLGMGGLLGLVFCFAGNPHINITLPLMVIILLCGIVSTSRLILAAHTLREIYLGLMFGILAQLIAFWLY